MTSQLATMHPLDHHNMDKQTEETSHSISMTVDQKHRILSNRECVICGSKAIGVNFGVPTCAPCKAFFRRNARRREIFQSRCDHRDIIISKMPDDKAVRYSQMRRCSSCRLRRCFDVGMKEELVRTDEENVRHRHLVDLNRQQRKTFKQKKLPILQCVVNSKELLCETDWRHLSNIVSAFDTYCLKTYAQQRVTMFTSFENGYMFNEHCAALPLSLTVSIFSFLRSLPAFHSLSNANRSYLCENNLRSLIFPNMIEVNQSCFSESWQIAHDKTTVELICGPELFERFVRTEKLAEKSLIADPIITRLWLVVLFFSSPLFCLYDKDVSLKVPKKISATTWIQSAYVTLLWNYLLHRHDYKGAVHIFSNLIQVYLKMQHVGFEIGTQVRTRPDLLVIHESLNQLTTCDIHGRYK